MSIHSLSNPYATSGGEPAEIVQGELRLFPP